MKKLVFMFVAMAAISFASCGGNNANGGANDTADTAKADSNATETVVEEGADSLGQAVDSTSNDSVKGE